MKYIFPEYYSYFKCKCGDCRHSCCDGWPISISITEYYRLLGIDCSDQLRAKLDCALKLSYKPGNQSNAQISNDWRGICMLHRDDGLCALQMELGENYLPNVCRLYPRNIKQLNENYEISCSNSCEAVVELLINMKRPLLFEEKDLSFHPEFVYNLPATKYEHCKKSISLLQERDLPLPERFLTLGSFLYGNDIFTNRPDHLGFAFQVLHILNRYYESNLSTGEYCTASQKYFCIGGNDKLSEDDLKLMTVKYTSAAMHLESILPDWQILFEQLFVNHMFYNKFPYTDHQENTTDAFLTLVITYAFLRINILGYMSDNSSQENLIDFLAAMFRLIEHSNFKFIASNLLKKGSDSIGECVLQLLYV